MSREINIWDVRVGCWYCLCCEHDLYQIKNKEELIEVINDYTQEIRDYFEEDYTGLIYRFWKTKEDALSDLVVDN